MVQCRCVCHTQNGALTVHLSRIHVPLPPCMRCQTEKNPTCPTSLSLDDKSALVVRSVHNSWFTGTWSFYLFIWHYTRVLYSLLDDTCALGSTAVCVHDLWPRTVTLMLTEYMPEDLFTYTGQWTVTETLPSCSCIMKSVI